MPEPLRGQRAATAIQTNWRRHQAQKNFLRETAVTAIQTTWRRHQAQRNFVQGRAVTIIQTSWRRHQAQRCFLYSLVHIIVVQSIARRFLAKSVIAQKQHEAAKRHFVLQQKDKDATTIQKAWRGFWGYSHFVIVRYDITRIQALARRRLAKRQSNLRLSCVILIQGAARHFLACTILLDKTIKDSLIAAKARELRERNAVHRIQFWWRIVLDWSKEKRAALTIERFFIFVKTEVDREIHKREMKRLAKEKKRKEHRRQSEDNILEKVWLNTVDENLGLSSSTLSSGTPRSKSSNHKAITPMNKDVKTRLHLGGFNEPIDSFPDPPSTIQRAASYEFSIVSNITNPSVFQKLPKYQLQSSQTETTEELDLDFTESLSKDGRPPSARNENKHRLTVGTEDYIRKYGSGLQTTPNRLSQTGLSEHFFAEKHGMKRQSLNGTTNTTQSHTQICTLQGSNAETQVSSTRRRSSSGNNTPMSISIGTANTPRVTLDPSPRVTLDPSPRVSSTPRSTTNNSRSGPATPCGSSISGGGTRRRESSSPRVLPPVTPTSRHPKQQQQQQSIYHRGTSDTESQTTMSDTSYYSRSSPKRLTTVVVEVFTGSIATTTPL